MRLGKDWLWMVAVAALAVGAACGDDDDDDGTAGDGAGDGSGTPPAAVSFEQQVHPVLVARCSACHGDAWGSPDAAASYAAAQGQVNTASPAQSPLYLAGTGAVSGHPSPLTTEEAALVLQWIQEGATGPAGGGPTPISFAQDVHPFLVTSCGACHGTAWGSPAVATSYAAASEKVNTSAPAQSPLYVRGTGGSGHPSALSAEDAQTLLTWIEEGAQDN